jgi:hypothetical protein
VRPVHLPVVRVFAAAHVAHVCCLYGVPIAAGPCTQRCHHPGDYLVVSLVVTSTPRADPLTDSSHHLAKSGQDKAAAMGGLSKRAQKKLEKKLKTKSGRKATATARQQQQQQQQRRQRQLTATSGGGGGDDDDDDDHDDDDDAGDGSCGGGGDDGPRPTAADTSLRAPAVLVLDRQTFPVLSPTATRAVMSKLRLMWRKWRVAVVGRSCILIVSVRRPVSWTTRAGPPVLATSRCVCTAEAQQRSCVWCWDVQSWLTARSAAPAVLSLPMPARLRACCTTQFSCTTAGLIGERFGDDWKRVNELARLFRHWCVVELRDEWKARQ